MKRKIRILYVLDVLSYNSGVSSVVMSYIRNIDRELFDIDVVVHKPAERDLVQEVCDAGFAVIQLPDITLRTVASFQREFEKVVTSKRYDIIHGHVSNSAFLYMKMAKQVGIPQRIIHFHNPVSASQPLKRVRNDFLERNITNWANRFFACSEFTTGPLSKSTTDKVIIIPNAIQAEKFVYNPTIRKKYREQLNISPNTVILGHVGRMDPQKNHKFLIDVFQEYQKLNSDSCLLLVGQGKLEPKMRKNVHQRDLQDKVMFLGKRSDVPQLYQAMDVFVFPSKFEGFGIVGVEAQCAGLPCFFSNNLPKSIAYTENVQYLPIRPKNYAIKWAEKIAEQIKHFVREDKTEAIQKTNFEIRTLIKKLEQYYINITEEGAV